MRKLLITTVFSVLLTFVGYGQYGIDYGFSVGASNYLGEIGGGEGIRRDGFVDMKLNYSRWTLGGFFRYRFSQKFAIKGSLNYIRLSGDDSKTQNPARRARNLNFRNDMFEFIGNLELYLYRVNDVGGSGRYSTDFNLYLFGGAGLFYSNPKGQEENGGWVSLQPLQTEGVSYSRLNLAIPLGLGFYYTIQRKYRLGMEIGWRTTFTDYIDDVSSSYANDYDGISNKTSQALIDEINEEYALDPGLLISNYDSDSKRGDPDHNDSYVTATINFSWAIKGKSRFRKSRHSWILGKSKRRRKSRAKF